MPEIHYAEAEGADIAYTITGSGDIPLVWTLGYISHLEVNWAFPLFRNFAEALGEFVTLVLYDKRGMGLSSRGQPGTPLSLRMDDIGAVMDHAGIERAAIMGESEGGPLSTLFAAAHPDRVSHLILQGAEVRERSDDDWPWGDGTDEWFEEYVAELPGTWGKASENWAVGLFGEELGDPAWAADHLARLCRHACSPREAVAWQLASREIDVRDLLPSIRVPSLVLHCEGDRAVPVEVGRHLAEHIPNARYVERPGSEHLAWLHPERVTGDIKEFLTGERATRVTDRILATVLFTDLVGSTDRAARLGDTAWRGLLETHHTAARREFAAHRGIEVGSAGDGFLARFDSPGRAIRCAEAIVEEAGRHGLEVRAGVHTGEVELIGDDIAGIGVHIGARVGGLAGPGEILVSSTVRDISAGSGISFVDRGRHELKGIPGDWQVYAVER